MNRTFLTILKKKLSYGSTRSVLLNCIPGRLISRLALNDFDIAQSGAANAFLNQILSEKAFTFILSNPFETITETMSEAEKDERVKVNGEKTKLEKRLASLQYDHDDFEKEYGVQTFGFGFPLLVRRNPNDLTKMIVAPLFIWPLQIKKSFTRNREWQIIRDPEQPIRVNEALRAYLKTEQHLELPLPADDMLDDGLLNTDELNAFMLRLKALWPEMETAQGVWQSTKLPASLDVQKESTTAPRIISEGVFALYKNLKQSLIQDVEILLNEEANSLDRDPLDAWYHKSSPVNVDPSQHAVLRSLANENRVVIQGPPGTGKSQTLTAIIATALTNQKKVLVVCEKRTALDVIYNNLIKRFPFLQPAIAFVEDVSSDRQTIVKQFRERESGRILTMSEAITETAKQESAEFETLIESLEQHYGTLRLKIKDNKRWADWVAEWLSARIPVNTMPAYALLAKHLPNDSAQLSLAQNMAWLKQAQAAYQLCLPTGFNIKRFFQSNFNSTAVDVLRQLRNWQFELTNCVKVWEARIGQLENSCEQEAQAIRKQWEQELNQWQAALQSTEGVLEDPYSISLMESMRLLFGGQSIKDAVKQANYFRNRFNGLFQQLALPTVSNIHEVRTSLERLQAVYKQHLFHEKIKEQADIRAEQTRIQTALQPVQAGMQTMLVCPEWPNSLLAELKARLNLVDELLTHDQAISNYWQWRELEQAPPLTIQQILPILQEHALNEWSETYRLAHVYALLQGYQEKHTLLRDDSALDTVRSVMQQLSGIQEQAMEKYIHDSFQCGLKEIVDRGFEPKKLYNLKGSAGTTRNSLRKIVQFSPDSFLQIHPLVLANPSTCSSLFPMESGFFDLVIFDEASQLRIEDTYSALLRGKAVVVSGDSQQMPPSSYFESNNLLLDDSDLSDDMETLSEQDRMLEESNLEMAGKESLLEWAIEEGYCETSLDMHYRSRHPDLIEFSNACFYRSRLVPMPETQFDVPIRFYQVDGIYDKRVNEKEADEVIRLLREEVTNDVSVGVATFNLTQRNLILDKINEARMADPDFHAKMGVLDQLGFFVKNLENIQGDERDVLILSTTFGVRSDGKFIMNFGPLTQRHGHRLLNVIITRARSTIFVLTSIPPNRQTEYRQAIEAEGRVSGKSGLLAYLHYARFVSEGNQEAKNELLQFIQLKVSQSNSDRNTMLGLTESPFEEEVYTYLVSQLGKERVIPQYRCGGFRIDLVVTLPLQERKIAIECDGAAYHSDELTWHHDIYRQQQLEAQGFVFHRIWSTRWWENQIAEEIRLLQFIRSLEA